MGRILSLGAILGGVLAPQLAFAQGLVPCGGSDQPSCEFCHIFELLNNIITFFLFPADVNNGFAIVPIVAGAFILYGGFLVLMGGANPQWLNRGRQILIAVAIGLVITYAAWVFISMMMTAVGVAGWTGLGSWWQIECGSL